MSAGLLPVTRVELELTEDCDLRCAFCYNSREPAYSDCAFEVLEALAKERIMELVLTGGEPSLHPAFMQIVDHALRRFPRVMVQSNGVRFAEGTILEELARRGIFCVNFSLHGPAEAHDALTRVPGSFARTVEALRSAVRLGIRTASNLVLTSTNTARESLVQTVAVLSEAGVREMVVTRFVPCGLGKDAGLLPLSAEALFAALETLWDETSRRGMTLLLANSAPACKMPGRLRALVNRCSFGFDKFYVDVRGNVLVCGMARRRLGNILQSPLSVILSGSPLYLSYRQIEHIPPVCRSCVDLPDCGGGCRAAAMAFGESFDAMDLLSPGGA